MLEGAPYRKSVWLVASLVCVALIVVLALSGSYLVVSLGTGFAIATLSVFLLDRYYLRRDRALRFGAAGTALASLVIWLIVFAMSFWFFYLPYAKWHSS